MSTSASSNTAWTPQVGDRVIVRDPDDYIAEVRNKIRNGRVGEIRSFQASDPGIAWVVFPGAGRRKEYRHQFRVDALAPAQG